MPGGLRKTSSVPLEPGSPSLLFFLFGRPAYLFPIMLGVACFVMFRQSDAEEGRTRYNTAVRIGGFTLMLVRELRPRHTALVRR